MGRRKVVVGSKEWMMNLAERARQLFEDALLEEDKDRRRVLVQAARGFSGLLGQASKKLLDTTELEKRLEEAERRQELILKAGRGEGKLEAV